MEALNHQRLSIVEAMFPETVEQDNLVHTSSTIDVIIIQSCSYGRKQAKTACGSVCVCVWRGGG